MKKFFLVLLVTVFCLNVSAQGPGRPGFGDPKKMMERQVAQMKDSLNLSADQVKAVTAMFEEEAQAMQEMFQKRQQGEGPGGFDREAMRKRNEERAAKIKAILTPEQYAKYEQMMKNRHGRRPHGDRQS